jgi:transcriptional regulator with XRE-family HTH domain
MSGESPPSADFLAALAERENVDIGWLLTGVRTSTPADRFDHANAAAIEEAACELRARIRVASEALQTAIREAEQIGIMLRGDPEKRNDLVPVPRTDEPKRPDPSDDNQEDTDDGHT